MKKTIACLLISAAALVITSCKKESVEIQCTGGTGGNLQVRIIPDYDGNPVMSTENSLVEAHVAFGKTEFPGAGNSNYNRKFKGKKNEPFVNCNSLKCGLFYFYVTYSDELTGESYSGGIPLGTDQPEGTIELKVPLFKN